MYNGGGNLAETMVFGRVAGANAAKRARGEFEGATGVAPTHNQELAQAASEAAAASVVSFSDVADGTYEGEGRGFGGSIKLSVTVEGGKVTACEVVEESETPAYGGTALPVYCEQVVEVQDLGAVNVVAGASNTLRGFKEAVTAALAG